MKFNENSVRNLNLWKNYFSWEIINNNHEDKTLKTKDTWIGLD